MQLCRIKSISHFGWFLNGMNVVFETVVLRIIEGLTQEGALMCVHVPNGLYERDELRLDCDEEVDAGERCALLVNGHRRSENCTTYNLWDTVTSRSFVRFLSVLCLVSELQESGRTMSLRDVYYTKKDLFSSQAQCNDMILSVGSVVGLRRHEMGIVPAARGFVAGPLRYRFLTETASERMNVCGEEGDEDYEDDDNLRWTICAEAPYGEGEALISGKWTSTPLGLIQVQLGVFGEGGGGLQWYSPDDLEERLQEGPRHLLVIEKEGIFRRLSEDSFGFPQGKGLPGTVMVTGCGFPDVATRHFVTKLCQLVPNLIPVGLCDYNPYGLALMLTYDSSHCRSAAQSNCFKGFREIKDLGVQLRWLGLRSPHIAFLTNKLHKSVFQPFTKHDAGQLRRLERLGRVLDSSDLEEEVEAMKKGRYMNTIDTIHNTILQRIHSFHQQLAHPCSSACPDH
jgi:DNA topoisomerase VI subunit A